MKFYYREENQSIEIIRCFGCDGKVVLPECIDGLPVEKVAAYTFSDRRDSEDREFLVYETEDHALFKGEEELLAGGNVEEIIFPDTVREIGNYIFYGCKKLRKLEFSDALVRIGGGAFTGCGGLAFLKVHMKSGRQSCVKEILGELWQRIDVTFCYEQEGRKAVLVFPEHYEEAVENTPARILFTQHHGSGNNYRQCFYNKVVDYRKYDSLFSVAAARDKADVLADMALWRLACPYDLSDNHKRSYENMIRDRYQEVVPYLIKEEHFDQIKLFTAHALWDAGMLEFALETAAKMGRTEILSYLMNEKQKSFPTVRKEFRL